MKNKSILKLSFVALFAAIISVGCFISIPIGVVPIVLQNALAILSGVLLGTKLAGAPTALFLVAGLVGLPVYAGGASGVAVWMGPTGGFLPGYLIGAIVAGLIAGVPTVEEKKNNLEVCCSHFNCYVCRHGCFVYSWYFWFCTLGYWKWQRTC